MARVLQGSARPVLTLQEADLSRKSGLPRKFRRAEEYHQQVVGKARLGQVATLSEGCSPAWPACPTSSSPPARQGRIPHLLPGHGGWQMAQNRAPHSEAPAALYRTGSVLECARNSSGAVVPAGWGLDLNAHVRARTHGEGKRRSRVTYWWKRKAVAAATALQRHAMLAKPVESWGMQSAGSPVLGSLSPPRRASGWRRRGRRRLGLGRVDPRDDVADGRKAGPPRPGASSGPKEDLPIAFQGLGQTPRVPPCRHGPARLSPIRIIVWSWNRGLAAS